MCKIWERNVLAEFEIKGKKLPGLPVHLNGKLDKIEFLDSGNNVNVVDYKTRQPLSKNEIQKRGYKRQLVFYKLLLDSYESGSGDGPHYRMVSGELDFIEPNEKGEYKKEKFTIEESEIAELKETIARVADEILNLKFWNTNCGKKDCQYCVLRKLLQ